MLKCIAMKSPRSFLHIQHHSRHPRLPVSLGNAKFPWYERSARARIPHFQFVGIEDWINEYTALRIALTKQGISLGPVTSELSAVISQHKAMRRVDKLSCTPEPSPPE